MKAQKIDWSKLEKNKKIIANWKKLYGTERAINFSQGILGLQYGEYTKNKERIRKFVKKL